MRSIIKTVFVVVLLPFLFGGVDPLAQGLDVIEKQCPKGQRADDFAFWVFIENSAIRTADEYAMDRNPDATFVLADVDPVFQFAGEYAGNYLVKLVMDGTTGVSFAMLKPNFPFCGDPDGLDDSRSDLFSVVIAKHNGHPF
jgi:hypothetical protein